MKMAPTTLRRRQLDRVLSAVRLRETFVRPRKGWISEVRNLIGMRAHQVASRLGISTSAVLHMERSEAEGSITLRTLQRAADALDCHLVYGFVPRAASYEELVQSRAHSVAMRRLGDVSHSMALEDQEPGLIEREQMVEDLARDLIQRLPRDLWDEES